MRNPSLTLSDLELLHEALTYMAKRVFEPAESVRLRGMLDRVEDLLLDPPAERRQLRLSPPEQEVLVRQVDAYCGELTGRGASALGRTQATRLRGMLQILSPGIRLRGRKQRPWWRRLFGR